MSGKYLASLALLLTAALPGTAQTWDTGGNGQLSGTYYFREVAWQGQADSLNDLSFAAAIYGTISFDGQGHYTLSGAQEVDFNGGPAPYSLPQPGTYSLATSGYGFLDSLLVSGDTLNVLFSNGVLVGSSTDNTKGYNDLFIAAQIPANPTLQGTYSMVGLDSPPLVQGSVASTRAYSFPMTADGNGGIGNLTFTGYFAGTGSTAKTQSMAGVRYHMSGGAAVVQFAGELNSGNVNANLMSGQKYFYFSPDGNFIFGGSPFGWDMIVGVRQNSSAAATFNGLYYTAGFTQDDSPASANGYVILNSGYGSFNALTGGLVLAHQRVLTVAPSGGGPYDYTYSDIVAQSSGAYSDSFTQYSVSANAAFGIGFARQPGLGIEVLVQASVPGGQGVYISPIGIVNAGSYAPFTASWAPGELVSIFGTNLASTTATDGSLPTMLRGVQVLVNGAPAPIYFVSAGQINAVIPVGVSSLTASVQVINNGTPSNTVFNYIGLTAPGVFNSLTLPAIQHANYTMVSASSPAQPGETLLVYLTGLGTVDTSGNATQKFTASIGGMAATIAFAGTQSMVGGGYQMNVTVPAGVTPGNVYLDISGPDSYNSEVVLPVGAGGVSASQPALMTEHRRPAPIGIKSAPRRRP